MRTRLHHDCEHGIPVDKSSVEKSEARLFSLEQLNQHKSVLTYSQDCATDCGAIPSSAIPSQLIPTSKQYRQNLMRCNQIAATLKRCKDVMD
jgi:hypothetical protein